MIGTFANIRLRKQSLDDVRRLYPRLHPAGRSAGVHPRRRAVAQHIPLVVFGGKEYGRVRHGLGGQRTLLLACGDRQSFERSTGPT